MGQGVIEDVMAMLSDAGYQGKLAVYVSYNELWVSSRTAPGLMWPM
mgnify:CR=1 FL=1